MKKIYRSFSFLNFSPLENDLTINLHLINNRYNYNYFKFKKKADLQATKQNLYKRYLLNLCEYSHNIFLIDGFANRIRLDSTPRLLENARFCIGDLDSVYAESFDTLSALGIPFIFYEDQDKTDLEKSLDISQLLQTTDPSPEDFESLGIELVNPNSIFEPKNSRLKHCLLKSEDEGIFLKNESYAARIKEIDARVDKSPPMKTVVYDYMGNRSDHVM